MRLPTQLAHCKLSGMDMTRGLQEVVSRNVRVLMAVHDITHQKDLAAQLNWGADKLTRTLNGTRRWSLDDLADLARVFGVTPASLLSDTTELVGAVHPTATSRVSRVVSGRYHANNGATVIPFPQSRATLGRYLTHRTRLDAHRGERHFGQTTSLIGASLNSVTGVTTVVGL